MAYEIEAGAYYARVLDHRTYGAITQDILSRYLHPFVIDSKLLCPKNSYFFESFNKYYDTDVTVALNTRVSNNCQIGKFSKIGTHCIIEKSTIGQNCSIGKNVKISNSYIWDGVEIGDNCEIKDSIICNNVIMEQGSKAESGCMIAFGIHVKENAVVAAGSMVSRYTYNSDTQAYEKTKQPESEIFKVGAIAYLPRESQLEETEMLGSKGPYEHEEESDIDEEEEDQDENERIAFENETRKTLERCVKNKFNVSNAIMEVKNLKMTYNMEYSECVEASFPVLMDIIS
jgi:translation initiation factor eIF-2B subunit epsilon